MTSWNYRVFLEENGDYVIREVFYDEDGWIIGCTENPVEPFGRNLDELAKHLEWFKDALGLPTLTLADIPCKSKKKRKKEMGGNISHEQLLAELSLSQ
ncbi:MAG: hypothetical protein ACREEM_34320 [Blastocatellia bacterium]